MKYSSKGFNLVELMIAMVIASVVIIAAYKYLIIGTKEMSTTVNTVNLRQKAVRAFENIREDLKFVGYNPKKKMWPIDEKPAYRIKSRKRKPANYLKFVNFIKYASFNPKYPDCPLNNLWDNECSTVYRMDSTGNVFKDKFDEASSNLIQNLIINNACLAIIYWDQTTDEACTNQQLLCSKTVKLILSIVPDNNQVQQFDKDTCTIPGLDFSQYIHLSEKVFLTNLKD